LENIRTGVLVNLGFLPAEFRHPFTRRYMLSINQFIEIQGMVTKNRNLQKGFFSGKDGNVKDEQRFSLGNFDLKALAKYSSLSNSENISEAVIERVDLNVTDLDEKDPIEYNVDLNATQEIPFGKVKFIFYLI
jgi:hypothetical protein